MSSPPEQPPKGPMGRGRGRGNRRRSQSPKATAGRTSSLSPKDRTCGEEDTRVILVRPGSNSPPQLSPTRSGLAGAMTKMSVLDKRASPVHPEGEGDKRGSRRGARPDELDFMICSKPDSLVSKIGTKGTPLPIVTNYYRLNRGPMWQLYGYHAFFEPLEDRKFVKKYLVRSQKDKLGAYIFDGMKIFTSKLIEDPAVLCFTAEKKEGGMVTVTLQRSRQDPVQGDPTYIQFYHLILRKCLFGMELEEIGRHFYDRHAAIALKTERLVLWPGYVTSLRQQEKDVMLCVEVTHKVLRLDNVLTTLKNIEQSARGDPTEAIQTELRDTIVMTTYNRKTYRIDDVDFNMSPQSTFDFKGTPITYIDYYSSRYQCDIRDKSQPMLVCRPSKKDVHRGFEGNVVLIPELCQLTGLTDAMRSNFQLMKKLSTHLHMGPADRGNAVNNFIRRLTGSQDLTDELAKWGIEFDTKLAPVDGRVLGRETMIFAKGTELADDKADWTKAFRSQQMVSTIDMDRWAIIVPQRDSGGVDELCRMMSKVSNPLDMKIRQPCEIFKLMDIKPQTYIRAINTLVEKYRDMQMLFVILPNNKLETYATVKKRLAVDLGIPSQCFVAKNVTSKGLMSIATKVVVQMNAKLGGEPWTIKVPLKNLMVVGFDVYHGAKGTKGGSIGAMVSSLSPTLAKYYSTTSVFNSPDELSKTMLSDFTKCCNAYAMTNGVLPDRIILFRDGVGEGQLSQVYSVELEQIKLAMQDLYTNAGKDLPKFTFIVVTKKINTRLFADFRGKRDRGLENPPPGTVVDDVVTIPDRYDFFLISCAARQGTVSPCSYNVLYDTQGLDPDKIQLLTYKMCHMYFNWSGTVAVPAPCQYAHKLAFITGTAYTGRASEKLSNLLHFL